MLTCTHTRNPSSVDQFDQTAGNPGPSMAAPRCSTRLTVTRQRRLLAPSFLGHQTQTRLEQKCWWKSLKIIKLYYRNLLKEWSPASFLSVQSGGFLCGGGTSQGTHVSLVKLREERARMMSCVLNLWIKSFFPNMLGQIHSVALLTANQGALERGSLTRTCQFSQSARWTRPTKKTNVAGFRPIHRNMTKACILQILAG